MKKIILTVTVIVMFTIAHGQQTVEWAYSAVKRSDKTYEIHLTPAVKNPWHIYSQASPEGGALPTKIIFNKNPLVTLEGKVKERGKVVSKYEEVFEVTVKYFEGKADFVQAVKLKANVKTNVTGTIEFMACNDEQCLPPAVVSFSVELK